MPYIGQDWRQPGELWVRTTEGWERLQMWRLRFLENLNENVTERRFKLMRTGDSVDCQKLKSLLQPHVFLVKGTRERKMQTSLSEAFNRLDMIGAVKDIRRFRYVASLLDVLIKNKLSEMSGAGQRLVFSLLEEMIQQVVKTETNVRVMQQLLDETRTALTQGQYYHIGSAILWQKHAENLDKMQNTLTGFQYKQREDDGGVKMSDLPDDCVRSILKTLTDHKDIVHTGLTETRTLDLAQEIVLWKNLVLFHFDNLQICSVMKEGEDISSIGWHKLYLKLVKRYGMRDVFADEINMCKLCNALFWESHDHPCLCPDLPPRSSPLSPSTCVQLLGI